MIAFVVTLQLLLFLPSLPLALMSHRTSRGQRGRHHGYVALASLIMSLAVVGMLTSLALSFDEATVDFDPLLNFLPPLLTLAASGFVVRRGLMSSKGKSRRRSPAA